MGAFQVGGSGGHWFMESGELDRGEEDDATS